ncbi:MAG: phosphatase PAP2 family protein, partial [Clostridia bacterium]|nr:phosphatase PAP2 family protein [Clostridia bacterium]
MEYLLWLQGVRSDFWNVILMYATELVTSPLMYLFVAVLYWCFAKNAAITLALNISIGSMINQTLKNIFCVYRPWVQNPALKPVEAAKETATGYSFPSGHTQLAATEFLSIAAWQRKRKWLVAVCFFMTFLVMFTRNYLGVHTLPDVLASFLIACFVVLVTPKLLEWIEHGKNRDLFVTILVMILSGLTLVYTTLKSYPMDYLPDGRLLVSPKEMITDCYRAAG